MLKANRNAWSVSRPKRILIALALVAIFLFGKIILIGENALVWWNDLFWTITSFAAAWKCYVVAGRMQSNLRIAWTYFGHACSGWFIGMLAWNYMELIKGVTTPFPFWSDVGFLLFAPLFMIGLVNYRSMAPSVPFTLLQFSKQGLIVGCIIIIHLVTLYGVIYPLRQSPLYLLTALAYPVLFMTLFVQALNILGLYVGGRLRYVMMLLVVAVSIHAATSSAYAFSLLHDSFQPGNFLDVFWIINFILIYLAGFEQLQVPESALPPGHIEQHAERNIAIESMIPPLVLLITMIIAFIYRDNVQNLHSGFIIISMAALIILLGIRELASAQLQAGLNRDIRRSEAEYRSILENMHDTYYRTDENGRVVRISSSAEALLGYRIDELLGHSLDGLYVEPDGRNKFLGALQAANGNIFNYEAELYRKDGSTVWVSSNARYIFDENGGVCGVEGTTRNVSERKETERILKRAHEELEIRVRERTLELERARIAAEDANRAKSDFLSRMSHELRTPMNAILGFAQLLDSNPSIVAADQRESIGEILESGYHLLDLINDVLDLSRIESGRMIVSIETIDLIDILDQCMSMVKPMASQRGIRVAAETPGKNICLALADPTRLRQIIINILSNAIKYNRDQGKVNLVCDPPLFGRIRINIIDTGPGISCEHRDKLFMPFERLGAEATNVEGTGIGLTIAKRLAKLMDGEIGLASSNSEGSHFYVDLPAAAQRPD